MKRCGAQEAGVTAAGVGADCKVLTSTSQCLTFDL